MRIPERCRLPHWAGGWPGQAACPQGTPADRYRLRFFIFSFRRSAMNVFDVRVYAIGAQGPPPVRSPLACRWPGPVPFVHHQGAGWQLPRRGGPGRAPGPGVRPGHWRTGAVGGPAARDHHLVPARGRLRPPARSLRAALYGHAFNPQRRSGTVGPATGKALAWLERASLPIQQMRDPRVIRLALDALAVRLDGHPAAANTIARKRAAI